MKTAGFFENKKDFQLEALKVLLDKKGDGLEIVNTTDLAEVALRRFCDQPAPNP